MTAITALKKNIPSILTLTVLAVLTICLFQTGIFSSGDKMELFLKKAGILAPAVFIAIQILQVVFPLIPGGISCVIGVVVFGPLYGFVYNYAGMVIGSGIAFWLGRKYGKSFILKFVSEAKYQKYEAWLDKGKKFDILFSLAIFLPCSPDDLLCMIAGLTSMSFRKFMILYMLCKPLSLAAYSVGFEALSSGLAAFF